MCRSRRPLSAANTLIAGLALAVAAALPAPASLAQDLRGADFGTLQSLLDQLSTAQSSGAARRATISPLDRAREQTGLAREEGLGAFGEGGVSEIERQREVSRKLLRRQICAGSVPKDQLEKAEVLAELSPLEKDYCRRLGRDLEQFGYDVFHGDFRQPRLSAGAVPDDYVLGIGDEIVVNFHGQDTSVITTTVDREGRVVLPDMPPIPAAGRTFGEFRRELQARTSATRIGTEVFVSVGQVRLTSVVVVGAVKQPGVKQVTGLSSLVDALQAAEGVRKSGSLRRVQLRRGNAIRWIDLYDLLLGEDLSYEIGVQDGDRVIVPPIGATIAVAGLVNRPGIYELAEGEDAVRLRRALQLAGGTMRPRGLRLLHWTFDESGRQVVDEYRLGDDVALSDGDLLMVGPLQDVKSGTVEIVGHIRLPGSRPLAAVRTIRGLVPGSHILADDPYLPFAVLETTDMATQARHFVPIDLQRVFAGEIDFSLREYDRLIVLSGEDIRFLTSADVQDLLFSPSALGLGPRKVRLFGQGEDQADGETTEQLQAILESRGAERSPARTQTRQQRATLEGQEAEEPEEPEVCAGIEQLAALVKGARAGRFANAIRVLQFGEEVKPLSEVECPEIYERFPDLLPFALEHVVAVNGEVRRPGIYPVSGEVNLATLIAVSGGLTREVDLTNIEISRFSAEPYKGLTSISRQMQDVNQVSLDQIAVGAGDVVRFNPVFTDRDTGPVVLSGEFVRPGIYEIRRGETLSQVTRRAGGLTEQAYPYGAIFMRERVRREEQQGFVRAARELNASLTAAAVRRNVNPETVISLQRMATQLSQVQALGRVVIESDPAVLQVRPELDTVLEPGDRIFMPKRPNYVSVIGDVLNPGALQFVPGTEANAYIRQAGDFQRSADEDRTFVVFPDGRAQPLSVSAWNFTSVAIPPGSTIVVPKDPLPFDLLTFLRDVADISSRLALTAASLNVLVRD